MAGHLLDEDPELAYEHAQAAVRRAGRVDVVREAAALAAYATGRYSEALRELRTVRRLSGREAHRAIEADCERGLGRPERALSVIAAAPAGLDAAERLELALVESGARVDLDEAQAALAVLERAQDVPLEPSAQARLDEAMQEVLVVLGRAEPAPQVPEGQVIEESASLEEIEESAPLEQSADSDVDPIVEISDLTESS